MAKGLEYKLLLRELPNTVSRRFKPERWVTSEEGELLRELIRMSGASLYVESGTANGISSCWASYALPNGEVHTFDPVDRPKIWDEVSKLKELKERITTYQTGFEVGVGSVLSNRDVNSPIVAFIDGDHSSGGVERDFNAIEPYLVTGDMVIFHDLNERSVGRAWQRIQARIPKSREIFFKTKHEILVIVYDSNTLPIGDESNEPIVIKLESEMNWANSKVKNTAWANDEKPWADYPEHALLSSSESHLLYDTAKRLGEGNYANLGTYTGASVAALALGLKHNNTRGSVMAVDTYSLKYLKDFPQKMMDHFVNMGIDHYVKVCKGTTDEWADRLSYYKFKFIFIDADHTYEQTKRDFKLWSPMLESGGEIAFHDVEYSSVAKVLEEELKDWILVRHVWRTKVYRKP